MRRSDLANLCSWLVALGLAAPATARAQEASASGSLGAGVFGSEVAASAELGVDVSGEQYALGIGGRLRWVADEGVRSRDWDEVSEWATLVRYLLYTRAPEGDGDGVRVAAVMGQLGGVSLGHGALIQGYSTGLDVDHRRLGAQVRLAHGSLGFEGLLDDVIAPRVAGVRGSWQRQAQALALAAGLSAAADFTAPRTATVAGMPMPAPMPMIEHAFLPMVALDGSVGLHDGSLGDSPGDSPGGSPGSGRHLAGTLHAELAAISTLAAGLHLGLTVDASLGRARLWGGGAISVGTDGYVPGWVGPLYERDRAQLGEAPGAGSQLDRATAGGLGHIGSRITAGGRHALLGEIELAYAQRPGLPDLATARLAAPYFRDVQGALWGAVETGGQARVLALELRARLPRGLFVTAEAARLYRTANDMAAPPGALAPWWLATLALGASIDLDRPRSGLALR